MGWGRATEKKACWMYKTDKVKRELPTKQETLRRRGRRARPVACVFPVSCRGLRLLILAPKTLSTLRSPVLVRPFTIPCTIPCVSASPSSADAAASTGERFPSDGSIGCGNGMVSIRRSPTCACPPPKRLWLWRGPGLPCAPEVPSVFAAASQVGERCSGHRRFSGGRREALEARFGTDDVDVRCSISWTGEKARLVHPVIGSTILLPL